MFVRVCCFLILIIFGSMLGGDIQKISASNVLHNFINIEDLNRKEIERGAYHIEGYVVHVYSCPACPEQAVCKPCMADNIIISRYDWPRQYNDLTDHEIIIFVKDSSFFKVGEKYRILLQVLDVRTIDQPVNNVKLIYSEKLK